MNKELQQSFSALKNLLNNEQFGSLGHFAKARIFSILYDYAKFISDFQISKISEISSAKLRVDIKELHEKLAALQTQHEIQDKVKEYESLQKNYESLLQTHNNLDIDIQNIKYNINKLEKDNKDNINYIAQLEKDYQDLVHKLEDIQQSVKPIEEAYKANKDTFDKHFTENKRIWGAIDSNDNAEQYVNNLINDIQNKLNDLDKAFKEITLKRDSWEIVKIKL